MTFIIAEVGSNWTTTEDCLDSIVAAKECGADCVKFQMYTHKELYGYDGEMAGVLPREWVPLLHAKCEEVKIEFMCTAFSPEGYQFIDPYVKRHKIASAENCDPSIVRSLAESPKPLLVSTGGCSFDDIAQFPNTPDITVLYCVSAYPAKNIDLKALWNLKNLLGIKNLGYSCHTDEWFTPVLANYFSALSVVEKHFKIREMNTPDNSHSILPADFKKMVDSLKNGHKTEFPHPDEADFIKYSKRRYIPELGGYYRTKKP